MHLFQITPNATKNGYVLLHRVVMENHLGRLLEKNEVVLMNRHNSGSMTERLNALVLKTSDQK